MIRATILLATSCVAATSFAFQATAAPAPVAGDSAPTSSATLTPALGNLRQTLDTLRLDKWKTTATVREETDANIASIRRDLDATLPPLLADADAAPYSIARGLPVFRNVNALYDVLLRVASVGRLSAPSPQSAALEQATASLEAARRTLGDTLTTAALTQEKKVADLQADLRAVPPAAAPVAPAAPCVPPASKHKARPKLAPRPAPPAN